jgi:hypothetical protein
VILRLTEYDPDFIWYYIPVFLEFRMYALQIGESLDDNPMWSGTFFHDRTISENIFAE